MKFYECWWKTPPPPPPDLHALKKPSPYRVKIHGNHLSWRNIRPRKLFFIDRLLKTEEIKLPKLEISAHNIHIGIGGVLPQQIFPVITDRSRTTLGIREVSFFTGRGDPENWRDQVLFLRSKRGIKRFFQIKKGAPLIFFKEMKYFVIYLAVRSQLTCSTAAT